ncbi:hypothetical protein [Butyrivibrio sp. FC2001]|uniref:hypothetical protein n=1 Tax=Butyrivibrio sp. FC2001 TaxID=1280671 RepID=UPI0004267BAC|nr:hypothetical protein [Butyrivibrio sp. FC2001]
MDKLPENVEVKLEFADLETEQTWDEIDATGEYDIVVAHYIDYEMKDYYEGQEKTIARYEDKLLAYFQEKIEKNGEFTVETRSQFWHCYKK